MNDCLVTKLKGTIDNNNLPVYNTAFTGVVSVPTNNKYEFKFKLKSGSCTIDSDFEMNNTYGDTTTKYHHLEVTTTTLRYITCNIPNGTYAEQTLKEAVKITGIYEFEVFEVSTASMIGGLTQVSYENPVTYRSGLQSLLKYSPLKAATVFSDEPENLEISDSVEFLDIQSSNTDYKNTSNQISLPNLVDFRMGSTGTSVVRFNLNKYPQTNNTHLRVFLANINGLCTNIPPNIVTINCISLTGNLEDMVDYLRGKGRTSGDIIFTGIAYAGSISFNNKTIRQHYIDNDYTVFTSDGFIANSPIYIFSWTNNSMEFASSVPASLTTNGYWPIKSLTEYVNSGGYTN